MDFKLKLPSLSSTVTAEETKYLQELGVNAKKLIQTNIKERSKNG